MCECMCITPYFVIGTRVRMGYACWWGISTNLSSKWIKPVCWWKVLENTCNQTLLLLFALNFKFVLLFLLLTLCKIFNKKNFQVNSHMLDRSKGHVLMHQKTIKRMMTSLGHSVGSSSLVKKENMNLWDMTTYYKLHC